MFVFFKGLLIGLAIAAPVGPIGLLCIRTTLMHGRKAGLATGAGAACADAVYAVIGVFGVVIVTQFLNENIFALRLIGGLFLLYLGMTTLLKKPAVSTEPTQTLDARVAKDFITTFFLTITNPATIFSFMAIFAGLGINTGNNTISAVLLVLGVWIGSLSWWYTLSLSVSWFSKKISQEAMRKINIASGSLILLFGCAALLSLTQNF